jgi:hypothetical protein
LVSLNQVHAPLSQLDPRNHSVFAAQRGSEIPLRHASSLAQGANMLAQDTSQRTVDRPRHARIFPATFLASKMGAD